MASFDTASSSSFGPGTVNTSPTVVNWSHNNTGDFLLVSFLEFSGVSVTVKSATFNGVAMTALGTNSFYLQNPPKGNYTISVSLTHSGSWTGSGIGYVAGSWKNVKSTGQPIGYVATSNGLNTISSSIALPSALAWHIGMGYVVGNSSGIAAGANTSMRTSIQVPNSAAYFLGIFDSNGQGSYPGSQTLTISNTSSLNQGAGIMDMMIENALSSSNFLSFF